MCKCFKGDTYSGVEGDRWFKGDTYSDIPTHNIPPKIPINFLPMNFHQGNTAGGIGYKFIHYDRSCSAFCPLFLEVLALKNFCVPIELHKRKIKVLDIPGRMGHFFSCPSSPPGKWERCAILTRTSGHSNRSSRGVLWEYKMLQQRPPPLLCLEELWKNTGQTFVIMNKQYSTAIFFPQIFHKLFWKMVNFTKFTILEGRQNEYSLESSTHICNLRKLEKLRNPGKTEKEVPCYMGDHYGTFQL